MDIHLTQAIRTAEYVIQAMKDAGITEEDPDFAAMVEAETDALERLRQMFRASRMAKAEADAALGIAEEIKGRAERTLNKADTLKSIILQGMLDLGLSKLPAPDFTLSVVPGKQGVRGDGDPELIPDSLVTIKRTINKTAIKEALEAGQKIPGFTLSNGSPHLRATK